MRLSPDEIEAIKAAALETFGASAVVRLFDSRVDDALEDGDVDLHVEVDPTPNLSARGFEMKRLLWRSLDCEKIDLLVSGRGGTPRGFERIAYRDGLVL